MDQKNVNISGKLLNEKEAEDITNDDLKQAITALRAVGTRDHELAMFNALRNGTFLMAVQVSGDENAKQIHPFTIQSGNGDSFLPAFSDVTEAERLTWPEGSEKVFIACSMQDYETLITALHLQVNGAVVNPFTDGVILSFGIIHKLNTQNPSEIRPDPSAEEKRAEALRKASFSEPRIYPTVLINGVYDRCADFREIERVWFKQMKKEGTVSFAFIVDAEKLTEETADALKETAESLSRGTPVEIIPWTEDLHKRVIKDAVPMYDRNLVFN